MDNERLEQLKALLEEAKEKGDDDKIIEIESELFQMDVPGNLSSVELGKIKKSRMKAAKGGEAKKGRGVKMKNGGEVKALDVATSNRGSSKKVSRGGGAAIRGTSFKGVF